MPSRNRMFCVIIQRGGTYHGSSLEYNYLRNGPAGQSMQSAGLRPQYSSGGTGPYGKCLPLFLWRLRMHSFQRDHDHEHPAPDLGHLHLPVKLLLIQSPAFYGGACLLQRFASASAEQSWAGPADSFSKLVPIFLLTFSNM